MTLEVPDGEFTFDPKAVVGIVGNAVHESIRGPVPPIVYLPMAQEPLQSLFVAGAFIAVRSEAASPERLSRSVATALESVDPDVRVSFLTGTGIVPRWTPKTGQYVHLDILPGFDPSIEAS